jgi:vacuolar-type H+-ATPase subunit H
MPSKDLLEKLFDVEREAEAMVSEALAEAGRRVDAAKTLAQENYTRAYDTALAKALAAREQSEASARAEYDAAIEAYRKKLESSRLDLSAFAAACEAAMSGGR